MCVFVFVCVCVFIISHMAAQPRDCMCTVCIKLSMHPNFDPVMLQVVTSMLLALMLPMEDQLFVVYPLLRRDKGDTLSLEFFLNPSVSCALSSASLLSI